MSADAFSVLLGGYVALAVVVAAAVTALTCLPLLLGLFYLLGAALVQLIGRVAAGVQAGPGTRPKE